MFRPITAVATLLVVFATAPRAFAHQELYHNVDVDLVEASESGVVSIYFTIHAPELLVGFEDAADAMFDKKWLSERSDEELERMVGLSRAFVGERFAVAFEGADNPVDVAGETTFDEFERIRSAVARKELPPACLLGTLRIKIPPGVRRLRFGHAADSQKRLLMVVIRPKKFPDVEDIEAGESALVALPVVDGAAREGEDGWIYAVIVGTMLAAMVLLQVRRGKRLVKRKLVRKP